MGGPRVFTPAKICIFFDMNKFFILKVVKTLAYFIIFYIGVFFSVFEVKSRLFFYSLPLFWVKSSLTFRRTLSTTTFWAIKKIKKKHKKTAKKWEKRKKISIFVLNKVLFQKCMIFIYKHEPMCNLCATCVLPTIRK